MQAATCDTQGDAMRWLDFIERAKAMREPIWDRIGIPRYDIISFACTTVDPG
jgi:hypothetical protein